MFRNDDRMLLQKIAARTNQKKTNNLDFNDMELRAIMGSLTDSMNKQGNNKGMFQMYGRVRKMIRLHLEG